MDRRELAGFLRGRREQIAPEEVGLSRGPRRRTRGLRREEIAELAFISAEYYTRLEQARAPHPSREVLAGLARALRLSDTERDHLHHLAGALPGPPRGPSREVQQSILDMLQRLPQAAAIVVSAIYEVIAWNDLAAALLADFPALPRHERNLLRRAFLAPPSQEPVLANPSEMAALAGSMVRALRATAARYPDDPEVTDLVRDLGAGSPEFARLWAAHDVDPGPAQRKTINHPLVGPLSLHCDVLDITDRDQRVVIYTAEPGSGEEEAMQLLSVIGTRRTDGRR